MFRCIYTYIHTYVCINTHTRTHMFIYIYIYIHKCVLTYIHTHAHVYIYIYTHTYMCINIHTHTHMHAETTYLHNKWFYLMHFFVQKFIMSESN